MLQTKPGWLGSSRAPRPCAASCCNGIYVLQVAFAGCCSLLSQADKGGSRLCGQPGGGSLRWLMHRFSQTSILPSELPSLVTMPCSCSSWRTAHAERATHLREELCPHTRKESGPLQSLSQTKHMPGKELLQARLFLTPSPQQGTRSLLCPCFSGCSGGSETGSSTMIQRLSGSSKTCREN